jgi:hypothetical protein
MEFGEGDTRLDDVKDLKESVGASGMSEKFGETAQRELARLERMNTASANIRFREPILIAGQACLGPDEQKIIRT